MVAIVADTINAPVSWMRKEMRDELDGGRGRAQAARR